MTGQGHRLTGISAGFFAAALVHTLGFNYTSEAIAAFAAAASTTLPDWLEIPIYKKGVRSGTLIPHRTITHWPPLWLGLMYFAFNYLEPFYAVMVMGIGVGALVHIVADAPNPMGVPWLWPNTRVSIFGGLWRSGEFEKTMTCVFTIAGVAIWLHSHQKTSWILAIIERIG